MSEFVLAKKTDMVALADALRELSGGTEELAFPGGMVAVVENGGGAKVATGSFTLSADTDNYTVTHDLGEVPKVILLWVKDYITKSGYITGGIGVLTNNVDENIPIHNEGTSTNTHQFYPGNSKHPSITGGLTGISSNNGAFYGANASTFKIGDYYPGTRWSMKILSGKEYIWVAVA